MSFGIHVVFFNNLIGIQNTMIKCHNCGTGNLDTSQFCDECGTKLVRFQQDAAQAPLYVPPVVETPAQVAIISEPPAQRPRSGYFDRNPAAKWRC